MQEHGWRTIELQQRGVEMEVHQVDEGNREQMSELRQEQRTKGYVEGWSRVSLVRAVYMPRARAV